MSAGWLLQRGAGGGQRVSAARQVADGADIGAAEIAMRAWGQRPLFRIGPGEEELDALLEQRGYVLGDPTEILAGSTQDVAALSPAGREERAIFCAAALACMVEIWGGLGVGPARLAVMERAPEPRVWLLGRSGDRPAGCAFAAMHEDVAMIHALAISTEARRAGLGRAMSLAAARWALKQGAGQFALAVTENNAAARALYRGLGLRAVARYHYRTAPEP